MGCSAKPFPGRLHQATSASVCSASKAPWFFGGTEQLLDQISNHRDVAVVMLRLSHLQMVDATGAHQPTEPVGALERRGVTVLIKDVRPEHIHVLGVLGAIRSLRHPSHLSEDLGSAVAHARSHIDRSPMQ